MTARQSGPGDRPEARPSEAEALLFWRDVLTGSRFTPLPGWCAEAPPQDRVAERRTLLSLGTSAALLDLAGSSAVPLDALLVTAVARVLATVTGDATVVTGYLPHSDPGTDAEPLPCPVYAGEGTWRELLGEAAAARAAAERHRVVSSTGYGANSAVRKPCSTPSWSAGGRQGPPISPTTPRSPWASYRGETGSSWC